VQSARRFGTLCPTSRLDHISVSASGDSFRFDRPTPLRADDLRAAAGDASAAQASAFDSDVSATCSDY